MRKILFKILLLVLLVFFIASSPSTKEVKAYYPLDYINYYEIKIDPREDGTLDMHFTIEWTVLDSSYDGPLEWVKIGIPNYHVDEIEKLTDNIKSIKYASDGGSYIEIYFKRNYYQGEKLTFSFSTHQSRMYFLRADQCYYHYLPGWFDEIEVENAKIMWNKKDVVSHNANIIEGDYLVWSSRLDYGETIKIEVQYNQSSFVGLSEDLQYTDAYMTPEDIITIVIIVVGILAFVIAIIIISYKCSDPYMNSRGFIGHSYYHWYHPGRHFGSGKDSKGRTIVNPTSSGFRGGSGGGSCACACACACAGGGRAGCSLKDFYKTNLDSEKVKKAIDKIEV